MRRSEEARTTVEAKVGNKTISIETGWVAKQAHGAVIVRQGDTQVLVTVCRADPRPGQSFFPMTVEYVEKTYAAGKIPGGYFKREARPGTDEVLCARIIDRPLRPMFPKGYMDEVQIIATVISSDGEHSADVLALSGASAALHISQIPFLIPVGGVKVGRVDGNFIINPSLEELKKSDIDLVVAGTSESIVMVEAGAKVVPEAEILDALNFGHDAIKKIIEAQEDLRSKVGKEKEEFVAPEVDSVIVEKVTALLGNRLEEAMAITGKKERGSKIKEIKTEIKEALEEEFPENLSDVSTVISAKSDEICRKMIVDKGTRLDNRKTNEVRFIECETGFIPRTHGSALFTRGETQAIVTSTIGTGADTQRIDTLIEDREDYFMLHYNFPPFCTGEAKMLRSTSRREIGHGTLAKRALVPVLPTQEEFPYVIRIVSEVTESNGSSSMASVCGGALAMMDAGVPIKAPVAGVAMGLIKEGEKIAILTDILGDEDHFGDMDFKVCGTDEGITALQMDIKCTGLSRETMEQALAQAKEGRLHILSEMKKEIEAPRGEMSQYAPRIVTIQINPDKIRDLIGPGGKVINSIIDETGVKIDIENNGTVLVSSSDGTSIEKAIEIINGITEEAEIGRVYQGVVKAVKDFGAFVEILPGTEGLLHISQISEERVNNIYDVISEGDEVDVKVLDVDAQGKIRLSKKAATEASA